MGILAESHNMKGGSEIFVKHLYIFVNVFTFASHFI